ncbi:hypothetical protein SSPSH_001590 [Salinisphaera shabanensis E1L3A]|uniref:Uncharacterized protein n=1 Tax=Salinisphaera shabanensis E1L3A TaxID=1033802 RepID=U2EMY8_9GAMM|nr:hypothetical protein SSPSH_001590 [Salinisphaera shabanensis E1L3A]
MHAPTDNGRAFVDARYPGLRIAIRARRGGVV